MKNPLPIFNPEDDTYVHAPLCVMSVEDRHCVYCGQPSLIASYNAYLRNFWLNEYEGDPQHRPMPEDIYTLIYSICLN